MKICQNTPKHDFYTVIAVMFSDPSPTSFNSKTTNMPPKRNIWPSMNREPHRKFLPDRLSQQVCTVIIPTPLIPSVD